MGFRTFEACLRFVLPRLAHSYLAHVLASDTLKTTTPLVNKVLLTWLTNSYIFYHASEAERSFLGLEQPRGIGYGIGLAFALFVMQGSYISLIFDQFDSILTDLDTEVASLVCSNKICVSKVG